MRSLLTILFILVFLFGNTQTTIWSENFDSYTDGTATGSNNNTDNAASDWTSGGCTCGGPSKTWEVVSGKMQGKEMQDNQGWLLTESIDISAYTDVQFSVDVDKSGDLEGFYLGTSSSCNENANRDFADVEYQIDGGGWTVVNNWPGWCGLYESCGTHTFTGDEGSADDDDCRTTDADFSASTVNVTGLNGTTLEIRLKAKNTATDEYFFFDNILVKTATPLPIELVNFYVVNYKGANYLNWITASELNNEFFVIERSDDLNYWEEIGKLNAAINSKIEIKYSYVDYSPNEISYYRLKQIDLDGSFTYSKIISIKNNIEYDDNHIYIIGEKNILGQNTKGGIKLIIYSNGYKQIVNEKR